MRICPTKTKSDFELKLQEFRKDSRWKDFTASEKGIEMWRPISGIRKMISIIGFGILRVFTLNLNRSVRNDYTDARDGKQRVQLTCSDKDADIGKIYRRIIGSSDLSDQGEQRTTRARNRKNQQREEQEDLPPKKISPELTKPSTLKAPQVQTFSPDQPPPPPATTPKIPQAPLPSPDQPLLSPKVTPTPQVQYAPEDRSPPSPSTTPMAPQVQPVSSSPQKLTNPEPTSLNDEPASSDLTPQTSASVTKPVSSPLSPPEPFRDDLPIAPKPATPLPPGQLTTEAVEDYLKRKKIFNREMVGHVDFADLVKRGVLDKKGFESIFGNSSRITDYDKQRLNGLDQKNLNALQPFFDREHGEVLTPGQTAGINFVEAFKTEDPRRNAICFIFFGGAILFSEEHIKKIKGPNLTVLVPFFYQRQTDVLTPEQIAEIDFEKIVTTKDLNKSPKEIFTNLFVECKAEQIKDRLKQLKVNQSPALSPFLLPGHIQLLNEKAIGAIDFTKVNWEHETFDCFFNDPHMDGGEEIAKEEQLHTVKNETYLMHLVKYFNQTHWSCLLKEQLDLIQKNEDRLTLAQKKMFENAKKQSLNSSSSGVVQPSVSPQTKQLTNEEFENLLKRQENKESYLTKDHIARANFETIEMSPEKFEKIFNYSEYALNSSCLEGLKGANLNALLKYFSNVHFRGLNEDQVAGIDFTKIDAKMFKQIFGTQNIHGNLDTLDGRQLKHLKGPQLDILIKFFTPAHFKELKKDQIDAIDFSKIDAGTFKNYFGPAILGGEPIVTIIHGERIKKLKGDTLQALLKFFGPEHVKLLDIEQKRAIDAKDLTPEAREEFEKRKK